MDFPAPLPENPADRLAELLRELDARHREEWVRLSKIIANPPSRAAFVRASAEVAILAREVDATRKHIGDTFKPICDPVEWSLAMGDDDAFIEALRAEVQRGA